MLEFSILTLLITALCLIGLSFAGFFYIKQRQQLAEREAELRLEKFANKQSRIVREIAARLPSGKFGQGLDKPEIHEAQAIPQAPLSKPYLEPQLERVVVSLAPHQQPRAMLEPVPAPILQRFEPGITGSKTCGGLNQPLHAPPAMPLKQVGGYQPVEITNPPLSGRVIKRSSTDQRPAAITMGERATVINYKPRAEPPQNLKARGTKLDFQLNLEASLFDQIKDYSEWLAGQSEDFILEVHKAETIELIPLLLSQDDLARLNGHWFDLFRPPDLMEITKQTKADNGNLICGFDKAAIEALSAPARQILATGEKAKSERYTQVLKESALADFIAYLEEIKGIMP